MKISVTNYDDYDEIEVVGMRFYSRGDERNFFYHLSCLNIQAWSKEDTIQFNVNYNLQKWQILEFIALSRRYEMNIENKSEILALKKIE